MEHQPPLHLTLFPCISPYGFSLGDECIFQFRVPGAGVEPAQSKTGGLQPLELANAQP